MEEETSPQNIRQSEAFKRELYRKSMDRIRVYNPTDKDHVIVWGTEKYKFIVPNKNKDTGWGKGQAVIERYLAEKYARDMKNYLIHKMADDTVKAMADKMEKMGVDSSLWKANETFAQSGKYKTDNPELIKQIYSEIWLGVEEEYGLNTVEDDDNSFTSDLRPVEEQILSTMDRKASPRAENEQILTQDNVSQTKPQEAPITETKYPINKKKKLLDEVSA